MLGLPPIQHRLRRLPPLPSLGRRPSSATAGWIASAGRSRGDEIRPCWEAADAARCGVPALPGVGPVWPLASEDDRTAVRPLQFVEVPPGTTRRADAGATDGSSRRDAEPDRAQSGPFMAPGRRRPSHAGACGASPKPDRPARTPAYCRSAGRVPSVTSRVMRSPPRSSSRLTVSPGENWASVASSGCPSSMTLPSTLTMMSPSSTPASAAGVPAVTPAIGWSFWSRATDERAGLNRQVLLVGQLPGDAHELDPEVRPRERLAGDRLGHDRPGHVDRDGEADAVAVGGDRGVDPDDVAVGVEQRAAGVAGVDRGVGLDQVGERLELPSVVIVRPLAETIPLVTEFEYVPERAADRDDQLADLERVGDADRRGRQVRSRRP